MVIYNAIIISIAIKFSILKDNVYKLHFLMIKFISINTYIIVYLQIQSNEILIYINGSIIGLQAIMIIYEILNILKDLYKYFKKNKKNIFSKYQK